MVVSVPHVRVARLIPVSARGHKVAGRAPNATCLRAMSQQISVKRKPEAQPVSASAGTVRAMDGAAGAPMDGFTAFPDAPIGLPERGLTWAFLVGM